MGRTAILMVLGLSALIGTYSMSINNTLVQGTKNLSTVYQLTQARDIAHSAVNVVLHKVDENVGVSTDTTFTGSFQNGAYTIRKQTNADTLWLTVRSTYGDTAYSMKLKLRCYPKPFPKLVGAVNIVSDSINFTMSGNPSIDGRDTNPDGTFVPNSELPAVAVETPVDSQRVVASGGTLLGSEGVRTSNELPDVRDYLDEYKAYATHTVTGDIAGNSIFGSPSNPAIMVYDGGGELRIGGGTQIYGVLVVRGDLKLSGTVDIFGMVIVYGEEVTVDFSVSTGTPQVYGGILLTGPNHSSFAMKGTVDYHYSSKTLNDVKNAKALRAYSITEWWE
ncbi:MAG TPA: hypothetical protein VK470_14170 [Bacteroidota bacterium]|nr:hypothetical protein [Bacteroidota bacterium]